MKLYIDPGTGSMLFTVLIGVLGTVIYTSRALFLKFRFRISGGKAETIAGDKIPIAIFSDHKRYWNIFEPVCNEFERRKEYVEFLTSSPDDPALSKDYSYVKCQYIGEGNKAFARLNTLKADIVLSSTPSLDVLYWKRSKTVSWYVHIGHAASDMTMYRMFGIDYYDAILTSGDYQKEQIRELEKIRNLPEKEIVKVGIPYMDAMKARLECLDLQSNHQTTVLLAPSWGTSAIFSVYGSEIIRALLETGYHVIIRPHPQSFTAEKELLDALMAEFPESDRLEWNRDTDNFDVLSRSDILISDFSGVIFDFALVFDKPVIYTDVPYDKAPYDACWLDEEPWTFRILPVMGHCLSHEDMGHMKSVIDTCLTDLSYKQGREKARQESWAYLGEGAARTVDYLLQKYHEMINEHAEEK